MTAVNPVGMPPVQPPQPAQPAQPVPPVPPTPVVPPTPPAPPVTPGQPPKPQTPEPSARRNAPAADTAERRPLAGHPLKLAYERAVKNVAERRARADAIARARATTGRQQGGGDNKGKQQRA